MKNINFVLAHMYHLKYFIPLVIEGNKRGIKSTFYNFYNEGEYKKVMVEEKNNALYVGHTYLHYEYLEGLADKFGFDFKVVNNSNELEGVTFLGEKRGLNHVEKNNKTYKVVLTVLLDFMYIGKK